MEDLLLDIRYALRVLWKSPAFTLVALVTLMLGIGANVVVFGVLNAVLMHPLKVSDPQNLYQLRLGSWTNWKLLTTSYPAFEDYQRRNTTFSAIAGFYGYCSATLHSDNIARSVSGYAVTSNYFDVLGVHPQVGGLTRAEDERGANSAPYIVLSDNLWRSAFNADPRVIGTIVRLNKDLFTVVGVAPPQFHGTEQFVWPDYFIPIVNYFDSDYLRNRTGRPLTVLGRLKPGVTPQQAAENLSAIAAQLAKEYPQTDTGLPLRLVRPGLYADTGDLIRDSLYSVTALALLVLAAACANLATLFTARAADRNRELAVRVALGASRWRLMRQLLTEASIVSLLGGTAGLLIAAMLLRVLDRGSLPSFLGNSPFGHVAVSVDARVYLVALVLTLFSGLLFGMIPARQVGRSSPLQAMKSGAVDSMPLRRFTSHDLLLGAQITICTLMVTSSIVAMRGMVRMLHTPLGFQPNVAIVNGTFARKIWGDTPAIGQRFIFLDHLREVVGVVEDGKYLEIQEAPQPVVYLPLSQNEQANIVFAVRSYRPANEMVPAIERALNAIEPNAPIIVRGWWDALAGPLFPARAATIALGAMGVLAAMLALTGVLGMAAYNVSRRMKELGIRVALGARAKHVMSVAVGRPIVLLGVGSLVGL